jgi:hypothetical protein
MPCIAAILYDLVTTLATTINTLRPPRTVYLPLGLEGLEGPKPVSAH